MNNVAQQIEQHRTSIKYTFPLPVTEFDILYTGNGTRDIQSIPVDAANLVTALTEVCNKITAFAAIDTPNPNYSIDYFIENNQIHWFAVYDLVCNNWIVSTCMSTAADNFGTLNPHVVISRAFMFVVKDADEKYRTNECIQWGFHPTISNITWSE